MLRELPQFQGISHAQKLSTEEERGLMRLYQEAPGRRGTERAVTTRKDEWWTVSSARLQDSEALS